MEASTTQAPGSLWGKKGPFRLSLQPLLYFQLALSNHDHHFARSSRITAETEACREKLTRRMAGHLIQRKSRACLAVLWSGEKGIVAGLREIGRSIDFPNFPARRSGFNVTSVVFDLPFLCRSA